MIVGPTALAFAAAFAGAAFYVNEAEQPARLALDDVSLLAEWKLSYARGFKMQASLALLSGIFGLIAAWQAQDWRWLPGAVLILANWPYTLLVVKPTNDQLNALAKNQAGPASRALIMTWARQHAVRTALGILAAATYLWPLSLAA
jgi:anthrone oxygenase-like protein